MKKHQIMLVIFFGTVLLACLQVLGCFHHHSHSIISESDNINTKILVDNREVSSDTEFEQYFGELSLQIPKGSCEDGVLSVSQTIENSTSGSLKDSLIQNALRELNSRASTSSLNNDFEIVSKNIYSISLTNRNKDPMLLSNPAKLTFNINNDYPTTRYYAVKKNESSFSLISPNRFTSSNLSFDTCSMSEWFLVKEKKYSQIEKAPIITCSSAVYTNGKDSSFKNDLEVKISVPYNQAGKYILNIYGRDSFPLSYNSISNSASNNYQINLTSLAQPKISSELATYSLTINLKEYGFKDFPGFIVLKAEYTDPSSGITYSAQKRINLLQGEKEVENNPHPFIVSSTPKNSDKTEIISVNDKITIEFSQPMDSESVEQALIFNPYVYGDITTKWSSDFKVLTISGSFDYFETYRLSINNTACAKTGLNLENNFVLIFGTPKPSSDNTETNTNTGSNTGNQTGSETNTNTGNQTGSETNTNTGNQTGSETNTNTGNQTGSETNTNTGNQTGSETNTNTGNQTGSETNTNTGNQTGSEPNTNTGNQTGSETNTNTGNQTGSETNTNTGNQTGSETNTNTGNQTGSETNTNTGSNTGTSIEKPIIISISPASYAENVKIDTKVTIVFSKEMNKTSVENALSITPALSEGISTNWTDNKTLIITPTNNWQPDTSYKVEFSSQAIDSENQSLENYSSRFKTVSSPLITDIQPGNQQKDIQLNSPITITFSKTMNKSVTQSAINVSPSSTISFSWEDSDRKLTITNSENWQEDQYIRISISKNAQDIETIPLANPLSSNFKTLLIPNIVESRCKPAPNSVSVATNTVITVVFNKEVNKDSAESAFKLRKDNSAADIPGTFNWNGNSMLFTPNYSLETGIKYNVILLSSYYDSNNSYPTQNKTWSFTTAQREGETWTNLYAQKDDETGFVTRTDHAMVSFNNYLWIIGGRSNSGNPLKDIYKSSDGKNWSLVSNNAAFGARFGHSCTVYNNKIWLSGGIKIDDESGVTYLNDIWNSSDGQNWTLVANSRETYNYEDDPVFSRRAFHNMLTYKNQLWVMLGESPDGLVGDIWCSTDGITWTDRSKIVVPRKKASAIVFNDSNDSDYESIFVYGGLGKNSIGEETALDELLLFKDKNINWVKESSNLGITPRFGSAITLLNNRIWLLSGASNNENNPSYISEILASNDGRNWTYMPFNSNFEPRTNHQAVNYNGMIVISGGENSDSIFNEVWSIK